MSYYTFKIYDDLPVVVMTITSWRFLVEGFEDANTQVYDALDNAQDPQYVITVAGKYGWKPAIMLRAMRYAASKGGFLRHPNLKEILIIAQHPGIRAVLPLLNTRLIGHITYHEFDTLDDALAYVRSQG